MVKGSMLIWTQKIRNNKKRKTDGYFLFACQSSIHSTSMTSSCKNIVQIICSQILVKLGGELKSVLSFSWKWWMALSYLRKETLKIPHWSDSLIKLITGLELCFKRNVSHYYYYFNSTNNETFQNHE